MFQLFVDGNSTRKAVTQKKSDVNINMILTRGLQVSGDTLRPFLFASLEHDDSGQSTLPAGIGSLEVVLTRTVVKESITFTKVYTEPPRPTINERAKKGLDHHVK